MTRVLDVPAAVATTERRRIRVRGAVQGVGFRPFVYRLALELSLDGWVLNDADGVLLEIEGSQRQVESFCRRLSSEKPPASQIQSIEDETIAPRGESGFRIVHERAAATGTRPTAVVLPDMVVCDDCRRELFDPRDRRYRYPFINCTNCGPRYSIVLDLPYDRPNTTMRGFAMCDGCRAEYENPLDRRFHAQPIACPACGPRLAATRPDGRIVARDDDALRLACDALRRGEIVAAKGLGGYQLWVDARDQVAVARLRERKQRPAKPLAVMVGSLAAARHWAKVSDAEALLLESREGPIVLLDRLGQANASPLAEGVAPGLDRIGIFLPTTPLHHLLFHDLEREGEPWAIVATSGNLSGEPIAFEDEDARRRLAAIADLFLVHDRPIARPVDDGVSWSDRRERPIRRARGAAPMPVLLTSEEPVVLAVGAHQKDVAALAVGRQAFLSQHLGDLETPEARAALERAAHDLVRLYRARPVVIAHDLHPGYPSTEFARRASAEIEELGGATTLPVQHHHAHLVSCLAEHRREGVSALGFVWDGTGFGPDGSVWGGELLQGDASGFERVARLRPFRLLGGEAAVREPRRVALALAYELSGGSFEEALALLRAAGLEPFSSLEARTLGVLLEKGVRSPWTSSMGRLFDGVAALLGIDGGSCRSSFEGEIACRLECAAELAEPSGDGPSSSPRFDLRPGPPPTELAPGQRPRSVLFEMDWRPFLAGLVAERRWGWSRSALSRAFHRGVAEAAVNVALLAAAPRESAVVLSGGCFQNRRLQREMVTRLTNVGFEVLTHCAVPANDGGIALGQLAVARARAE